MVDTFNRIVRRRRASASRRCSPRGERGPSGASVACDACPAPVGFLPLPANVATVASRPPLASRTAPMTVPAVFDTCRPRRDVLAGLTDADFAADLAQVLKGTATSGGSPEQLTERLARLVSGAAVVSAMATP